MATPSDLVRQYSISPHVTLLAAIEQITKTYHKILLVVADDGRLEGVVTDYDIRQAILKQPNLDRPVSEVLNRKPVVAPDGTADHDIVLLIQRTRCLQIPIVDGSGRPIDLRFHEDFLHLSEGPEERVAVVMAGGLGTRLRPMTEQVPKPLVEVSGRPILLLLLDQLISEGFTKVYVTLFYKSEMIIERVQHTPRYRDCVEFVIEDEPLGTAGSLGLLPQRPKEPFLIINADLLIEVPLNEMLMFHRREGNVVTVALKREKFEVPYGVAEVREGRIVGLREKPEYVLDVNTGVYVASPSVLDRLPRGVRLDMPQLVNELLDARQRVGSFPVHEFWLDVGTHEQLDRAKVRFANRATAER